MMAGRGNATRKRDPQVYHNSKFGFLCSVRRILKKWSFKGWIIVQALQIKPSMIHLNMHVNIIPLYATAKTQFFFNFRKINLPSDTKKNWAKE